MTRRHCLGLGAAASAARAQSRKPNVLIFFTDDQTYFSLNAINNPQVKTPNMDRLIRQGTIFTRAAIMGGTIPAVCVPSRAMLMTGQTLFHIDRSIVRPVKEGARPFAMMPETFHQNGYETFITGKWHNGEKLLARAFRGGGNIFFGGMADHLKTPVAQYDPSGEYPKDKRPFAAKFSAEAFSDAAIAFVRAKHEKPWFCYVAYTSPHDPRMAPKEYTDMYPPERMELPANYLPEHPFDNGELKVRDEALAPWPRTPDIARKEIAGYYAMITHVDAQMGRVMQALEETGQASNTIIVFAGDNGLAVGRHGLLGKQSVYEHSVRVPLVIGGPGLPKGKRNGALAYVLDVFPTLCELTGLPVPAQVDGQSLAPLLRGRNGRPRATMFHAYRNFQRAVKDERWKLILYNVNGRQTRQLFDLRNDPDERQNLADDPAQAARVTELLAKMRAWMKETGDPVNLDLPDWGVKA